MSKASCAVEGSLYCVGGPGDLELLHALCGGPDDRIEAPRSAMLPHVEGRLPTGASVLDVGAGSGRDVAALLACGLDAFGVEPNGAMRDRAVALHPLLQGRLRAATLPLSGRPFADLRPSGFDAVVCSAVLMHLVVAALPAAFASMVDQLRAVASGDEPVPPSFLFLSLPQMESSRLIRHRDEDGRRFHNHDTARIQDQLASLGMSLEESVTSTAVLSLTGTVWHTMVFRRGPSA